MRFTFLIPFSLSMALFLGGACSSDPVAPIDLTKIDLDASGQFLLDAPLRPDASCFVEINTVPLAPVTHVPVGTEITYNSNPPAGGPHYPIWAAYQEFTSPVDRRYWVHNLEHGGVVLLYKCQDPSGCPDIAAGLRTVAATLPQDPICNNGLRNRIIITPDPLLDVPVAAAGWGWTYRAACLDLPTLISFASDRYGKGTEITCAQGQSEF